MDYLAHHWGFVILVSAIILVVAIVVWADYSEDVRWRKVREDTLDEEDD